MTLKFGTKMILGIKRDNKTHIYAQNKWSVGEQLTRETAVLPWGR